MALKTFTHKQIIQNISKIIPPLSSKLYKGQAGRICIVGGSKEYTGAPYYAGMSSLRTGCDIAYVLCSKSASILKSYSPELIVAPILPDSENIAPNKSTMKYLMSNDYFGRAHSFVVGPGLGRDHVTLDCVKEIITEIIKHKKPLVIDGDGLYLISLNPDIISGYKNCVLTPNPVEFSRLVKAVFKSEDQISSDSKEMLNTLCKKMGNVTIIRKGEQDLISNGNDVVLSCNMEGSFRRCGGQGDVLAGVLGTFLHWSQWAKERNEKVDLDEILIACYAACMITRECNRTAFKEKFRGMTTPDMIAKLPQVFYDLFEKK